MREQLGFRYYITGMKDGKYGIKDIEDLVTEFYSYDEVMEIAKSVPIKGVSARGVDLNWFTGFIRKEWHFRKSNFDFITKTGLCFVETCDRLVLAYVSSFEDLAFVEFIGTFRSCNYNGDDDSVWLSAANVSSISDKVIEQVARGVGFNFITIDNIRSIPVRCLTMLDFDKMGVGSDKLTASVFWSKDKDKDYILSGVIKSSRPMYIEFSGNGFMHLCKLTSLYGNIDLNIYAEAIKIEDSFLDNLSGSFSVCASCVYVDDTIQLAKLVKGGYIINETGTFNLSYKIDVNDNTRHVCKVINSAPKDGIKFNDNYDMFVFMRKVKPRLRMTRELYNKFMGEADFSKRHYIDKVTFSSFVEFI